MYHACGSRPSAARNAPAVKARKNLATATAKGEETMNGEQTVLVTGGSGFLGSWCLVELLRRGYRARTTLRDLSREGEVRAMVASQLDAGDRLSFVRADLMSDEGWPEAVGGCDFVLHVASPFPPVQPKDPDEVIVPAHDGTLRVLGASLDADVKRIVLTSSVAAVRNPGALAAGRKLTDEDWTDPDNPKLTPYARSKTIAERAAWEFMRSRGAEQRLVVVAPSAIVGPVLGPDRSYSLQLIERLLDGMPGLPRLGFSFVDVRDVAALEVAAMTAPEAGGTRLLAAGPSLWVSDVAQILRERLGQDARKVPTRRVPDFAMRMLAIFDASLRSVVGDLGQLAHFSLESTTRRTGWTPRPVEQTFVDCAHSLLEQRAAAPSAA
jgi:nucleoside-diphosphate-sugar epimerase